jgi:hypothetical protein
MNEAPSWERGLTAWEVAEEQALLMLDFEIAMQLLCDRWKSSATDDEEWAFVRMALATPFGEELAFIVRTKLAVTPEAE